jgi:hypothetical protein
MNIQMVSAYVDQFLFTLQAFPRSLRFLREHRLWEGLLRYGWVSKLLIFMAFILSLRFYGIFMDWWRGLKSQPAADPMYSLADLSGHLWKDGFGFLFTGGMKYVVLFLFMVVIYHISNRALDILTGLPSGITFKDFMESQKRALHLTIRAFVLETVIITLLKIAFGILGFIDFLEPFLAFAVKCYFVGFVVVDSYQEQFGMSVKASGRFMRGYIGVGLAIGLVFQVLMYIPVAGSVIASFVTAVTAVVVMHEIAKLHTLPAEDIRQFEEAATVRKA